ncbi:sigma-70 factor domain-containing protein, partial [Helicobacter typhlonius]
MQEKSDKTGKKSKEINAELENLFKKADNDYITYEKIAQIMTKAPTSTQVKKIKDLSKKYKKQLLSSSEVAKMLNTQEQIKRQADKKKMLDEELEDEFDFMKDKELLEWSRSDSPVRMYLREMGQIPLLTKEEEISLSKQIELGENTILDAICSVPYLIDFIYDYKDALIKRERRVKELFKNFDDEDEENKEEEEFDLEDDEGVQKINSKKDQKRVEKVMESFKALDKAKKEWLKVLESPILEGEDEISHILLLSYKKHILKTKLLDLGPTSKLINELVKAMENTIKSGDGFERELKRLEYKLPLFNETLVENHKKILANITNMSRDEIAAMVPETTMVSVYVELKKIFQTKEA